MPLELTKAHISELNSSHREIVGDAKKTLSKVLSLGSMLTKTKEVVPAGQWQKWIEENLEFTPQTARNYMRCWDSRAVLRAEKIEGIREAYQLLASPPPPPEAKISQNIEEKRSNENSFASRQESCQVEIPASMEKAPHGTNYTQQVGRGRREPTLDATGYPIPEAVLPLWNRSSEAQEWMTALSRLKTTLATAKETGDTFWRKTLWGQEAMMAVENLYRLVELSKPYAVCLTCMGLNSRDCKLCEGRGYIGRSVFNTNDTTAKKERLKAVQMRAGA